MGYYNMYEYETECIEKLAQYYILNHKVKIEHDKQITVEGRKYVTTVLNGVFSSGMIVNTQGVNAWMESDKEQKPVKQKWIEYCLLRHVNGDCGLCCTEDQLVNEEGIREKSRTMSVYEWDMCESEKVKIWIITEYGHEYTTVLFPDEY